MTFHSQRSATSSRRSPASEIGGTSSPMSSAAQSKSKTASKMRRPSAESTTTSLPRRETTSGTSSFGMLAIQNLLRSSPTIRNLRIKIPCTYREWVSSLGEKLSPRFKALAFLVDLMRYELFPEDSPAPVPTGDSKGAPTRDTCANTFKPTRPVR